VEVQAIATDYDGTLAREGRVERATLAALKRARAAHFKLILVTGRELPSLRRIFSSLSLFDRVVAENGALLYRPSTGRQEMLCPAPSKALVAVLRERRVPLSVGKCVVATEQPHHVAVRQAIRKLGLPLHVIFNKEAVMILPSLVNKSTGLSAALAQLKVSSRHVVGIGDAENDHEFLRSCGCSVAVANAIPSLKREADMVTRHRYGAGVVEVINQLIAGRRFC
jgi:hypothetical protein